MEEQKKNELGNVYGSRVSKNGKWLNLLIVTHTDGKEVRITCPIRLANNAEPSKPVATIDGKKASISNIALYEDKKPSEAQAAAEDSDLPF